MYLLRFFCGIYCNFTLLLLVSILFYVLYKLCSKCIFVYYIYVINQMYYIKINSDIIHN